MSSSLSVAVGETGAEVIVRMGIPDVPQFKYEAWYMKNPFSVPEYRDDASDLDVPVTRQELRDGFVQVATVHSSVPNLETVYHVMQGFCWAAHTDEAKNLIRRLGLNHTSMSIGDIIYDVERDTWYRVASAGFTELDL